MDRTETALWTCLAGVLLVGIIGLWLMLSIPTCKSKGGHEIELASTHTVWVLVGKVNVPIQVHDTTCVVPER